MPDPFETLGVEARFDLDERTLAQRHRDLSKALHPDRYATAGAAERRLALSRAIDVNEAYRLLRDPIRRAEALLRRAGVPVGETVEPKAQPALLMEMMEAREELSDAGRARDIARVHALGEAMQARFSAAVETLGRAFTSAEADPKKLASLLPSLGELRYIRRFLDEAIALEEDLSP